MKNGRLKSVAAAACMALGASAAELPVQSNNAGSIFPDDPEHPAPSRVVATLAFGEHELTHIIERQNAMIRQEATEAQCRVAEQTAKTYYAHLPPAKKVELQKKHIHYLAVPTVRSKVTSPQAKEVLMIWDIPRESLASKNVYEVESVPSAGKLASYDDISAEYIGSNAATQ